MSEHQKCGCFPIAGAMNSHTCLYPQLLKEYDAMAESLRVAWKAIDEIKAEVPKGSYAGSFYYATVAILENLEAMTPNAGDKQDAMKRVIDGLTTFGPEASNDDWKNAQ